MQLYFINNTFSDNIYIVKYKNVHYSVFRYSAAKTISSRPAWRRDVSNPIVPTDPVEATISILSLLILEPKQCRRPIGKHENYIRKEDYSNADTLTELVMPITTSSKST